nr:hypothetical protein [Nocardia flavorosea]
MGHHARRPALIRARTVSGRTVARKVDITLAVLLSDDTSYVSGQFLAGDGGMVIR